jgi:predicted membrane chloride channel (bestrophin family)
MVDTSRADPGEKAPLLGALCHEFTSSYTYHSTTGQLDCSDDSKSLLEQGITDNMCYDTEPFTTWQTFTITYTVIWQSSELWSMVRRLGLITVLVAAFTFSIVQHPEYMQVSKFTKVSKFLNVVCGLLLGFFLSTSMNRWHSCVHGYMELMDAIRNLQMQLTALGVPEQHSMLVLRFGFASAWLLYGQLLVETKRGAAELRTREAMWEAIAQRQIPLRTPGLSPLLTHSEIDFLKTTRDPPGIMFMWIAALIGNLAQDGWIPGMPTPTYGRIMNLCQDGHAGIRQVRANISIQAPLTYSHMLSTLVHFNNLLNASTLGVVIGLAFGTLMKAHKLHWVPKQTEGIMKESEQDMQNVIVTAMYCTIGPLLYQALLIISMHLAQPFATRDSRMPLHRLLHQLEVDICNGRDAPSAVDFKRPSFKNPT